MKQHTTVKLHLSTRDRLRYLWIMNERTIRDASVGGMLVTFLALIYSLLGPQPAPAPLAEQVRPAILIQTAVPLPTLTPAPTWTPVPTPQPEVVYVPQPEVQVQYVEVYVPVEAAPTMPPYIEPTAAPPPDSFTAPLIGDDPNALACTNPETGATSPLCGGLTNQEARDALERQRNIQDHYVEPPQSGGSGKMPAPDIGQVPASGAEWCAAAAAAGKVSCVGQPADVHSQVAR